VYKRIERNKIDHERDTDGQLYVYVDKSATGQRQNVQSESVALTSALEARIESLERQLEAERGSSAELRRLLAAALERIPPQLEAPAEPPAAAPGDNEPPDEQQGRGQPRSDTSGAQGGAERVSWWRRMFRS
jgi:hypothetical protein